MSKTLQRVRGFPDKLSQESAHFDQLLSKSLEVIKSFRFERVEPPILEHTDLFIKTLGESSDVVNKEMYTFPKGEDSLTLRPEGTASVARLFITEKLYQQLPLKFFYYGPMFRHERPQKGRFRQFYQLGVEALGDPDQQVDIEILSMAWLIMKKLKIEQKVSLEINTIGHSKERETYKDHLKQFLQPHLEKLSPESQKRFEVNPLRILDSKNESDKEIIKKAPLLIDHLKKESLSKYENIKKDLTNLKIPFVENLKLVRGLDYYNDLVFEFTSPHLGAQSGVLAGGRYDSLIKILGGADTPAVGWGAGLERLMLLCEDPLLEETVIGIVSTGETAKDQALKMAYELREMDYKIYYQFSGNFSKQMKRIDQHNCSFALFYGEEEHQKQMVGLKDLKTKKQTEIPFSDLKTSLKKLLN